MSRIFLAPLLALALAALAAPARAELTAWDQAKVTKLGKQLDDAAKALYDTFYKQPKPTPAQQVPWYRLKEDVRLIKNDSGSFARALGKGAGRDETQPAYEDLMQNVRRAQDNAGKVFATKDLQDKAAAALAVLNQITPYYDAEAKPLEPVAH